MECGSCHREFPRHPGPGRPARYCSARCARRAKRARERHRHAEAEQAFYADIAAGHVEEFWITAEEAKGMLALLAQLPAVDVLG